MLGARLPRFSQTQSHSRESSSRLEAVNKSIHTKAFNHTGLVHADHTFFSFRAHAHLAARRTRETDSTWLAVMAWMGSRSLSRSLPRIETESASTPAVLLTRSPRTVLRPPLSAVPVGCPGH